jgi:hypothetical protein
MGLDSGNEPVRGCNFEMQLKLIVFPRNSNVSMIEIQLIQIRLLPPDNVAFCQNTFASEISGMSVTTLVLLCKAEHVE